MRRRHAVAPDPYAFGTRSYDLVKEFVIAVVVVALLTVLLAALFSSPDEKPITVAQWARVAPGDFAATAVTELDGTSTTGQYGPPYNTASDGPKIGPLGLQKFAGVRNPIDTAQAFVLTPLRSAPSTPQLRGALDAWSAATPAQQQKWTAAYEATLAKSPDQNPATLLSPAYGPVAPMMTTLLAQARSGSLDGLLLSEHGFYQTDYTLPLLFVADGSYMADRASAEHLAGDQWGMMNETGSYPGQAWLWLYTLWYQVAPFNASGNADALVWGLMLVLTLLFVFVPFLPGIRDIPRLIPIYKLIWRRHYRQQGRPMEEPAGADRPVVPSG
jgi:hypothetical protein